MRLVLRSLPVVALAVGAFTSPVRAQTAAPRNDNYRFWLGAQGGVQVFTTPGQTRGGIPMGGGNLMIKAKRSGLLISVNEGFGSNEQTAFVRADGTPQTILFNDLRTYAFHLMAFPLRTPAQPYFGVGFSIVDVINPQPANASSLAGVDLAAIRDEVAPLTATAGFSAVGGVNFNVGPVSAFGQYMYTGSARRGKLLQGPTHTLSAGLRFNLGSSRESLGTGGY